jgi:TonB family protein
MPLALLLSPDDQAVSAITGVLEEMSVTCERPLDGVSAAQLLNSNTFDLVLVDCENLPAAKLIFDVCRRGKNGNNPVPIAIVDGRAGLPTAFRLGAELILTKPVAKDQARTTIRTAVGRVRKDVPSDVNVSAQAAAAAAGSSQATEHADPPSTLVSTSTASAELNTDTASMHSAAVVKEDEIFAPVHSKPVIPLTPSDDPVLAELERTELEESESAKSQSVQGQKLSSQTVDSQNAESQNSDSKKDSLKRTQAHDDDAVAKSDAAHVFATLGARQPKRGPLVALMTLAIAGGGLYGVWMYEPGFRAIAQPQIDRVLALAGVVTPAAHSPNSVKPPAQPAPIAAPAPADSGTAQSTPSDSATGASAPLSVSSAPSTAAAPTAGASTATSGSAAVSLPSSPSSAVAASPKASASTPTAAPVISKPAADTKQDTAKSAAGATSNSSPSSAPLPGENTAIILSSQGAQKRLVTGAAPKYPAEARSEGAEGTVVLKAIVDEAGKVTGLRLVEGNATLAPAAMRAVKQWRYRPYMRDGKLQPFQTIVIVDFQR